MQLIICRPHKNARIVQIQLLYEFEVHSPSKIPWFRHLSQVPCISVLVRHSLLLLLSSALATSTAQTAHTQQAQGTIKNFKIRKDIIDKNPGADKEMFPSPSSAAADWKVSCTILSTFNSYHQQTVPLIFGLLLAWFNCNKPSSLLKCCCVLRLHLP